jgi:hypothetical protein
VANAVASAADSSATGTLASGLKLWPPYAIVAHVARLWADLTPLAVALLVTAVYGLYVLWRLRITGSDPSFFVVAGPLATDPLNTLPNLRVFPSGTTYDGQFFYRLALDPLTQVQTAYGITLDVPAYRQQRILYPLIVWGISFGRWQLTPFALIATNLGAVGLLTYAAATYARMLGRNALASVMVAFYPGYVVTISRDLAELTEAALLVVGLVMIERRRYWPASAALTAGMLAKETLLGVPIAGIALWAVRRVRGENASGPPLIAWLLPVLMYGAWSGVMALRWGTTGLGQGSVNFGAPFDGLVQHLGTLELGTPAWRAHRLELGLLALIGLAVLGVLVTCRRLLLSTGVLPLACLLYAALALVYTSYIWHDDYAYLRALHELFLTASLALLGVSVWAARGLGLATTVLWLAFALQIGPAP